MTVNDHSGNSVEIAIDLHMNLADWMSITPVMCHSIDADGLLVSVSDVWLRKLGYQRHEAVGQPFARFLAQQSGDRAGAGIIPDVFETGPTENAECRMVCKNGEVIDILLSAVPVTDNSGGGCLSMAVMTDVTHLKSTERKLAESELRYRHLVEHQSELVSLSRLDGELLYVNQAYADSHGRPPEELVGMNLLDFVPAAVRESLLAHLQNVALTGEVRATENQVIMANGTARWMSWTNKALKDENGVVSAIHSVGKDVDDRVDAERRVRESEARYRLLADNSTDMVFQLDAGLLFSYVSPACRDILGHDPMDLMQENLGDFIHPDERSSFRDMIACFASGQLTRHTGLQRLLHRDGHDVWSEMQLKSIGGSASGKPAGMAGTLRDFTIRKQMEDQLLEANRRLTRMAETDGLTGLLNRRAFDALLSEKWDGVAGDNGDLGLILADVDWFKPFNDLYGHPAGDTCLQRVSAAMEGWASEFGYLTARYGGEEFGIVLPGADETMTWLAAERLRLAVLELGIVHAASPLRVATISLGVASRLASASSDCSELIGSADRALYAAKGKGRNTVARASECQDARAHRPEGRMSSGPR